MDWIKVLATPPAGEYTSRELVLPQHANHYGTLFAPEALAMLGRTAYLAAARFSRQPVVMASVRDVEFLAPVPIGVLLYLHGRVVRLGRSSMTVDVRAALDPTPGEAPREVLRSMFEMVAVDAEGRPVRLEPRDPWSEPPPAAPAAPAGVR